MEEGLPLSVGHFADRHLCSAQPALVSYSYTHLWAGQRAANHAFSFLDAIHEHIFERIQPNQNSIYGAIGSGTMPRIGVDVEASGTI
jgi:hypothetical protein